MPVPTPIPERDPALLHEAHALRAAFEPYATLRELHASAEWPALAPRLAALLTHVRTCAPATPAAPPSAPPGGSTRLQVAHWNIEHGNQFDAIAVALATESGLAGVDLITLNEVDLGMARSGNRDVAGELAAQLGLHSVWAPMFLESTRGRDDDLLTAVPDDNAESLFGLAMLSRWPVTGVQLVPLPGPERTLFERERMAGRFVALVCEIAHPTQPFVAVTAHLEVHRTRAHRARQMRLLLAALTDERRPVVLTGDWNTHTFDRGESHSVLSAAWALVASPRATIRQRLIRPDEGPRRETLFEELAAAGFAWKSYTDQAPTLGMRFSRLGEVQALPGPLRALASSGMHWVERRTRLRLDWIATRGFDPAAGRGRTLRGLDGPGLASDHAPVVAELAP